MKGEKKLKKVEKKQKPKTQKYVSSYKPRKVFPPVEYTFRMIKNFSDIAENKIKPRGGNLSKGKKKKKKKKNSKSKNEMDSVINVRRKPKLSMEQLEQKIEQKLINRKDESDSDEEDFYGNKKEYGKEKEKKKKEKKKKVKKEKYLGSSLKFSNNMIESLEGLKEAVDHILEHPQSLQLLDLSFNQISDIGIFEDLAEFFPELTHLYLHANCIEQVDDVRFLKKFKKLKVLTIHGNPLDQYSNYRFHAISVLKSQAGLEDLKSLDFSTITKKEQEHAKTYSSIYMKKFIKKRKKRKKPIVHNYDDNDF